jgi:hypothetical protein
MLSGKPNQLDQMDEGCRMLKVLPWRITLEAGTSPLASIGVELSADGRPYGVSFDGGKLAAGDCSYVSTYRDGVKGQLFAIQAQPLCCGQSQAPASNVQRQMNLWFDAESFMEQSDLLGLL